jgi:adenosylcobinamide-GDP ribazoletransferase
MTPAFDPARWLADAKACLGLLTRIPVTIGETGDGHDTRVQLARASWAFPVAGALIGIIGATVFAGASLLGLPPWTAALLAIGSTMLISGALHEDGLADVADGFGGAFARDEKLAIMRDSRLGTYGTLALILSVALRAAALAAIAGPGAAIADPGAAIADPWAAGAALIVAHAGARAGLPAIMRTLPLARADGLAARAGLPEPAPVAISLGLAIGLALVLLGIGTAILTVLAAAAATVLVAVLAYRQIGGYTGDVLGAAQQAAEIAILLAIAAS